MSTSDQIAGKTFELVSIALALGARSVSGWSQAEEEVVRGIQSSIPLLTSDIRDAIERQEDPLGELFCQIFTNDQRRLLGATYTPTAIVGSMVSWASAQILPGRVVDPGSGSARFLVAAGRRFQQAHLVAIEIDPIAAMISRGHLAAAGLAHRAEVIVQDYRDVTLPRIDGQTLYIGNPPYVRHHQIEQRWKKWLSETALNFGVEASQLAGLHAHFFLATAVHAQPEDVGVLITASEWLDVNYGRLVRNLLTGVLGVKTIHVIEPTAAPFPGTQTTGVITGFSIGDSSPEVGLQRSNSIAMLGSLRADRFVQREHLEAAERWTPLTRAIVERKEGFVELGELCRVHRGQVTGANKIWVSQRNDYSLPKSVLFSTVTSARDLFTANGVLADPSLLKWVIDLPVDLGVFDAYERKKIEEFLAFARSSGVCDGFVASRRKAWWSVGLRPAAPILATYMARRPPAFVVNRANARHINVAHGLYPRIDFSSHQISALASFLSSNVSVNDGRTYAGGLTKFEPREMERLLVPLPDLLADSSFGVQFS